ncbi:MAG: tetraacyldisaccharide 4'-kinase, partial [Alistipes sp.]|nr:tetraacyldisaccharide 4'-kinase [Alistipes sp.]
YMLKEAVTLEDHHVYRVGDMHRLSGMLARYPEAVIVTTEKDAVKMIRSSRIPADVRARLYYQPINISFIKDSGADFLQKLEKDVRRN